MPENGNANAVALALDAAPAPHSVLPIQPASGRHRFSLKCARTFCSALLSTDAGPPPADRLAWLEGEIDALLERAGWRSGGFYKLTLILANLVAPVMIGIPLPLWMLSLDEQVRALTRMEQSPLASVVLAAKTMICIAYYEHPEAAAEVGFARKRVVLSGGEG